MSIAPVGGTFLRSLYPSADSSSAPRGVSANPVQSASAPTSDTVTLSPEAQALASFNAKGITVTIIHSPGLSSGKQPARPALVANGSMSKSDFEAVAASFGVTAQQADQDFSSMDINDNGSISNGEMLSAMSSTSQRGSTLSENLRQMMDTNQDGSVSGTEFLNLETALVSREL